MLACGVALLCVVLLVPVGAVGKKKKGIGKWWGTFDRAGPVMEARPGIPWDVTYTLTVSKKKSSYSLTDAVGRLNCWDYDDEGGVVPTSDYFQFAIPTLQGPVIPGTNISIGNVVFVPPNKLPDQIGPVSGQSESGRAFEVTVLYPRAIQYPANNRGKFKKFWRVEWRINWKCEGGAGVGGERVIFTYAARR